MKYIKAYEEKTYTYPVSFNSTVFEYVPYVVRFLIKNNVKFELGYNDVYKYFLILINSNDIEKLPSKKSIDPHFSFRNGLNYYVPFSDKNIYGKLIGNLFDEDEDEPPYNDENWKNIKIKNEEDIRYLQTLVVANKYNL